MGGPRIVLLDEDIGARPISRAAIRAVLNVCGLKAVSVESRRSVSGGRHWRVVVDRDLTPAETVALQACMGSDLKRETLNLSRVLFNRHEQGEPGAWNLLYDAKVYPCAQLKPQLGVRNQDGRETSKTKPTEEKPARGSRGGARLRPVDHGGARPRPVDRGGARPPAPGPRPGSRR